MLAGRHRGPDGHWVPAQPLILSGWDHSPSLAKSLVFWDHIKYAAEHGVLNQIDDFLRGLPEEQWAHFDELLCIEDAPPEDEDDDPI